ncbi:MAG: hypothetical protein LBT97_06170 [Planctomycetota bacterium]|jgi:hypothetical protein|nr:hypothetical protein [Planctomycetota bacterium]
MHLFVFLQFTVMALAPLLRVRPAGARCDPVPVVATATAGLAATVFAINPKHSRYARKSLSISDIPKYGGGKPAFSAS